LDSLITDPAMEISLMIAFGFGRAVSLDAGMTAGFRHQSRAS
jgi:hypothetical protein